MMDPNAILWTGTDGGKLVDEAACIAALFAEDARPAPRTWRKWKKQRAFPFVKIGRLVYYDLAEVRKALLGKFTVAAR